MKKVIFIVFTVYFCGCTTLKPNSSSVSNFDINKRVEIQNPTYYNQLNGVGIGSMVVVTAAGAYAGYQSKTIKYNSGNEQKTLDFGNAIMGAVIGYTLSHYANRLVGWGKSTKAPNSETWLLKANKNYTLLNSGSSNNIRAIHKSAESNFTAEKLSDAQDFARAFKNSPYTNSLIDQTLSSHNLLRSDFSDMAQIFAKSSNAIKLEKEYINRSTSVAELLEGASKYPNTGLPIEQMASDLVVNFKDSELFFSKYPNSKFTKQAIVNSLQSCTEGEVMSLYKKRGQNFIITPSEFKQLKLTDEAKAGYFNAQFVVNPPKSVAEAHRKVMEYSWIDYTNRPSHILNQIWKVGYTTMNNGDDLVTSIWDLSKAPSYKYYRLTPSITSQFIGAKLDKEVKNYVTTTIDKVLKPENPE